MTYGYWLDQAAAALDECRTIIRGGLRGGYARAPAIIGARSGVYRTLARIAVILTGPTAHPPTITTADYLINRRHRIVDTDPAIILGTGLQAAAQTDARLPTAATIDDPVIHQLNRAREALATAGDVLASHLGWRVGGPTTPEGQAIAQGTGTRNAVADIATLAITAVAIDRALLRWLNSHTASQTLRPLYEDTTATMTWWTTSNYPATLRQLARSSRNDSIVRFLDVAPATESSTGPRQIRSLTDVSTILDSIRAWMTQHPQDTSLRHIRAATRLALTIATTADTLNVVPAGKHRARRWLAAANSLEGIADLLGPIHPTISQDLKKATDWLRDHYTPGQLPESPATLQKTELLNLTLKLPDLAAQLHIVAHDLLHRGQLLVCHRLLDSMPRNGLFHATTTWSHARPNESATAILLNRLRNVAVGQSLYPNLAKTPVPVATPFDAGHTSGAPEPTTAEPAPTISDTGGQRPDTSAHARWAPSWASLTEDVGVLVHSISTDRRTTTSTTGRHQPRSSNPPPPEIAEPSPHEPDLA
ncbi:hypothetical protein [Rugosimonospora africana]|uniref:Uncharacterized protein n=1 Tax=Rugosimonospora africana TaxID=556532 RepID=A0A8J3R2R4_9ACTN|nr:hypothetical protein [Rugosimonospora africana]GIH21196.1 hypothetical protein Raf01_93680 [Rugosimonospora africana]